MINDVTSRMISDVTGDMIGEQTAGRATP